MKTRSTRGRALCKSGFGILFALALGLAPVAAHATSTDQDYIDSAQQYYDKGDLQSALIELKNALQQNPDNRVARGLLGKIDLQREDYVSAEKELSRAWNLGLQTDEIRLLLARARLALGNFQAVLQATEGEADASSPVTRDLLVLRGNAYLALGKPEEAAKAFQEIIDAGPHAQAYGGLARVAFANGRIDQALQLAEKALATDPKDAGLHALVGNIYTATGQLDSAVAEMKRALELDPKNQEALIGVTRFKVLEKDYQSAKDYVDQALRLTGARMSLVVLKGYIELALHNYAEARSAAESVLAIDSGNVTALYVAGTASFGLNDLEQARSRLTQYLSQSPGDLHAQAILGYLRKAGDTKSPADEEATSTLLGLLSTQALSAGATQTSQRSLEVMATLTDNSPGVRAQLSMSKAQAGDLSRAEEELSAAIRLDQDHQFSSEIDQAATALILSHLRAHNFEKAIQLTTAYEDRRPDQATAYTLLSMIYAEKGDAVQAQDAMQKALAVKPDSPELMDNSASLQARLGNIKGALEILKATIGKHEGHYPTLLQLASLSFRDMNPDQTIYWAQKALAVNANAVEPRILLARSYNVLRKYQQALDATQGLAESNPDNAALLEAVNEAQFNLGKGAEGVKTAEALVKAAPFSAAAYFYLARSYLQNGQNDLVSPTLQKALALDAEFYPARVAYARLVLLNEGNVEKAATLIDSLTKQYGDNPEVLELAGQLAMARHDDASAIDHLTAAKNAYAKGGVARRTITESLILVLWHQGDKSRALAEMQDWLTQHPDDVAMRLQVAAVQKASGDADSAAEQYSQILEAQPSNWVARNDLAMLLYDKGSYDEARKHAEIAYQQAGENPAVVDTLGVILLADGQLDQSLSLLQKANKLAPNQPDIALHLSQALEQSGDKAGARKVLETVLTKLGKFEGRDALEKRYQDLGAN